MLGPAARPARPSPRVPCALAACSGACPVGRPTEQGIGPKGMDSQRTALSRRAVTQRCHAEQFLFAASVLRELPAAREAETGRAGEALSAQ